MIISITILSLIGFMLSLYGFFIEQKVKSNPQYKPICDISNIISCSKPIMSSYGNMFYISNTLSGMIFYAAMMWLAVIENTTLIFLGSLTSLLVSVVLAFILYFKIRSFCLLCTAVYIINILLFVVSLQQ